MQVDHSKFENLQQIELQILGRMNFTIARDRIPYFSENFNDVILHQLLDCLTFILDISDLTFLTVYET